MPSLLDILRGALIRLSAIIATWRMNQDTLYQTAVSFIGHDASPNDEAPDEYGCMDSVSKVIQAAFPQLHFPTLLSTRDGLAYMLESSHFKHIQTPVSGCIVLSATGTGNGTVANGHTGIVGRYISPDGSLWIMSNDSRTGTWEANYTVDAWNRYYKGKGGMFTHYFLVV